MVRRKKQVEVVPDDMEQKNIVWIRTRSAEGFYTNPAEWKSRYRGLDLRLERQTHEKYLYQIHRDGEELGNGIASECFAHWNAGDVVKKHLVSENLI
ncbi:hypothetical protein PP304_gp063 [Gordonia phage Phendrix]|uniref:Uncharacterized protein n=2 Tax=Godonkavirus TaxID=2733178 RepID=A0A4D6E1Z4_9CAUD|nr:hypothetical protein HOV33_gp064 [Gordonia phage GodonK]YP_010649107.1 hypothetical protein PP304_gp063 [Gordonia phage Phendrix]QBZ72683.1 hypothetical protein SEA_GODONK_64 [Gordonia phage GodonK]QDK02611.1 hypothetical protein SEA_PHENDRIX_63 [Gordonia phage Phendrix]